jgi:hypothetical protein
VIYCPESSIWLFVVCTVVAVVAGLSLRYGWVDMGAERYGVLILLWPLTVAMLWSGRKRLVITRNDHAQRLCVALRRWPLAPQVSTYPIAEVQDAIVEPDMNGEALAHRVVLILSSGDHVPLTKEFCSGGRRHERAVHEIRALLNRTPGN